MVAKKSGGGSRGGGGGAPAEDAAEELARVPLQAILLADSFNTKFRPITLERPKVLLPLVNVPMIDYTLAWLESAGVDEVFVFCCAHSKQVIEYLNSSKWFGQPNFSVSTIESNNSAGVGDALRLVYEKNVIRGDFVLVSGDTVSNMSLLEVLREHKERRRKDSNAIMTMVVKRSKASMVTRQSRLGTDELFMAIDPDTKQLLYYDDRSNKSTVSLDKALLSDHSSIYLQNDKQDCYVDICAPEVLSTFADNFDYQQLRRHFVKGLLDDDIMGYKIFTHEIHSSYAARVENFRSYDTVSKDIIQRWTYPLVPDVQFSGHGSTKLGRHGIYRASEVELSSSGRIFPFTVIGKATIVGNKTEISNSVVGEGCQIGSNVSIEGCYIWHNVTIEDGCKLKHAIVCDGVVIKAGAALESGVVLSYKVVVGQNFIVPGYSKVSLYQQPVKQDSDEELECAESSSVVETSPTFGSPEKLKEQLSMELSESQLKAASVVGCGGIGFIWSMSDAGHEEEWRHSVAPVPREKLIELLQASIDERKLSCEDAKVPTTGELKPESDSDDDSKETKDDDPVTEFEKEVEATFLRAVHENVMHENIILEVNAMRLSYNLAPADCAGALFYSMMRLAHNTPHGSANELIRNTAKVITRWQNLLKDYLSTIDEEIEVILKFEEICLESTKEYSPIFSQILHLLYDKEIIQEAAILKWASEKEDADESDRIFVKQSESFIQWLNEASEEDDDEEDEDG